MKRRLQLSAALVHNPDLLVMDEPTAGIDPILRAKFWDRFRELRDQGRTIFVTSQYVTEAEYCDRVAILGEGRLVAIGTPEELRHRAYDGAVIEVAGDDLPLPMLGQLRGMSPRSSSWMTQPRWSRRYSLR
jgi:ABC-2 type transport system ATP-binding protein